MGSNKTDVDDPVRLVDLHHEAVLVPPDVEAHAIVFEDAGAGIVPLYGCRKSPICGAGKFEPGPQGLLSVSVYFPECPEGPARDDPHEAIYIAPELGSSILFPIRERAGKGPLYVLFNALGVVLAELGGMRGPAAHISFQSNTWAALLIAVDEDQPRLVSHGAGD